MSVGFGDISANTNQERLYALVTMVNASPFLICFQDNFYRPGARTALGLTSCFFCADTLGTTRPDVSAARRRFVMTRTDVSTPLAGK